MIATLQMPLDDEGEKTRHPLVASEDQGATWTPADGGFPDWIAAEFIFDPANAGTIYASYVGPIVSSGAPPAYGLVKSTDGGQTWTAIYTAIPGSSISSFAVGAGSSLLIDPLTPATIYAGTSGGIIKSIDGGANWNDAGLHSVVTALAIDSLDSNILYAATTTDDYSPPAGFAGLFKSTDAGANWAPIDDGLEVLMDTGAGITSLTIDPANPQVLYAGTSGNGIFRSADGGANWSAFNLGLTNLDVHVLAAAPGDPGLLYASTSGGIFAFPLVSDGRGRRGK